MGGVLRSGASGEKQGCAQSDEGGDYSYLDHGEPEFEASIGVDGEEVDSEKEGGKHEDPEDGGQAWKPELHVGGGGDHLGSDGDGDGEPVARAGYETGPVVEVAVSIDAEGAGGGMSAGEFAEGEGDRPTNEGGEDEAEDDCGSGEFDGGGSAEQESGADGTTDGDHGHLSSGELAAEAGLGVDRTLFAGFWVRGWSRHEGSYSYIRSRRQVGGKGRRSEAELRSAWTAGGGCPYATLDGRGLPFPHELLTRLFSWTPA